MHTLPLFLLFSLVFGGCNLLGVSDGDVPDDPARIASLTTGQSAYGPGAEVVLRLENETNRALGYNLCLVELQQRVGGAWLSRPVLEENEACPLILGLLQPGETTTYTHRLRAELPEGRYRFRTEVERMGAPTRETIIGNVFNLVR